MATKYSISQALRRIKKLKGVIATQNQRISDALVYKKDEEPAFSYEDSVKNRNAARAELLDLTTAVAVANANNFVDWEGKSIPLAGAIRVLSEFKAQIAEYQGYRSYAGLRLRGVEGGLRNKRETVVVDKEESYEDISDSDGNYKGQRKVFKEKKTTIICNLTEAERAGAIEKLEAQFEELNNALERANNTALFEISAP
jgi:hypothetical protein